MLSCVKDIFSFKIIISGQHIVEKFAATIFHKKKPATGNCRFLWCDKIFLFYHNPDHFLAVAC